MKLKPGEHYWNGPNLNRRKRDQLLSELQLGVSRLSSAARIEALVSRSHELAWLAIV